MNLVATERRGEDGGDPLGPPPPKPLMRGWLHGAAAVLSVPAGIALIFHASPGEARVAAAIYAMSLIGLFAASASYHLFDWSPAQRVWMKRLDHSMIFVLIAGTYTPFALLVLPRAWGVVLLVAVWTGALAGVALKMARPHGFARTGGALYGTLGWMVLLVFPWLVRGATSAELALAVCGGIAYTLGALALNRHRPDPYPQVFGYHEVWHLAVVVASACLYAAIFMIVSS
jgi:hemolysin III